MNYYNKYNSKPSFGFACRAISRFCAEAERAIMADEKRRTSLEVRFIGLWDDVPGGAPNRISEKIQDLIFRRV